MMQILSVKIKIIVARRETRMYEPDRNLEKINVMGRIRCAQDRSVFKNETSSRLSYSLKSIIQNKIRKLLTEHSLLDRSNKTLRLGFEI